MNKHRDGVAGYALDRGGDCALDSGSAYRHRCTNDGRGQRIPRSAAKLAIIGNRDSIAGAEGWSLVQHAVAGRVCSRNLKLHHVPGVDRDWVGSQRYLGDRADGVAALVSAAASGDE